jgi:hypothetical protein
VVIKVPKCKAPQSARHILTLMVLVRASLLLSYRLYNFVFKMVLVFGKASEFYISRRIQNGRSSFRTLQVCNACVFTDLTEEIVVITVICCSLRTEHKDSDDISETKSSDDIM